MKYSIEKNTLHITDLSGFALYRSCNCGQTFRWRGSTSENGDELTCVIGKKLIYARQKGDEMWISPCMSEDEARFFLNYFDLERNYADIESRMAQNPILSRCIPYAGGIRVFNQEPFETLMSFIVSANNNIKRITGIIDRMCISCGEEHEEHGEVYYSFPTAEALAAMPVDKLRAMGLGYRDEYISRSAQAIVDGFSLEELRNMPYSEAKKKLCTLHGVGGKVADCVLLFSLGHGEAFPMDVWMKRAVSTMFFEGKMPTKTQLHELLSEFGEDAGRIQQYIFHYARETELKADG